MRVNQWTAAPGDLSTDPECWQRRDAVLLRRFPCAHCGRRVDIWSDDSREKDALAPCCSGWCRDHAGLPRIDRASTSQ